MSDRKRAIETLKQLRLDYEEFYEEHNNEVTHAYDMAIASLETDEAYQLEYEQTTKNDLAVDAISRKAVQTRLKEIINEMETIFADIREREVDDSVCGLCEYDCDHGLDGFANECPGFEKDDCFKLDEKYKAEWLDISNLPPASPQEPRKGHWVLTDVEGDKVWHCNCSKCGKDPQDYVGGSENWWLIKSKLPKFCPNCGSDNREVEE